MSDKMSNQPGSAVGSEPEVRRNPRYDRHLATTQARAKRGQCEGDCERHAGDVQAVRVLDPRGFGRDWGYFAYCETARAADAANGFVLEAQPLRVWTNDVDWYIASDQADLRTMFAEHVGDTMEYVTGDDREIENWRALEPGEMLWVYWDVSEDNGPPEATREPADPDLRRMGDYTHRMCATAEQWIAHCGRGFLCSTEW